ncbi:uncharacterized protein LOC123918925 isoform X1 [Trifolium pratense]|nr:uncharacterized protein LOC123918925 isoform X1 [Trifolium pratense]
MEPEYDAELNYQKFNKFIRQHKESLKDERVLEANIDEAITFYGDDEVTLRPETKVNSYSITIADQTEWDHCHWTSGAKYEMTFELIEEKSILKKARIAEALIFAVNHRDPNKLVLFDKGSPTKSGKLKFWHNQVGQPGNGFFDSNGNILLRVQLQLLPYGPDREETSFHSLHRQFRLQLYWIKKKVIDKSFSKLFASHTTYVEKESRSADWESYLKDSSQELKVSKKRLWEYLWKYFNNDYCLIDIIKHGMKKTKSFLNLVEAADYHLSGPLGEFVAKPKYLPIQELTEDLTLNNVLKFEKDLVRSGWNVFLFIFLKLTLHDSFLKFRKQTGQQTNQETEHVPAPGVDSGGSAKIEHVSAPADSVGCSETKADVPDKGGSAADMIYENQAGVDIKELYYEVLVPGIAALGTTLNEGVNKIREKHHFTREVSVMVDSLFTNVQENALEVFNQEVNNSRIDDHKFDVQSIKFKPKPTAKIKDDTELEAEARRIGRLGEKYAYEYYKDRYNNVLWVNEDDEVFQPFDLTGFDKKNNSKFFIEAKATIHKRKKWFHISPAEYHWAMKKQSNYIIAHVYIDEKEGAEPKFTVTEFINPTGRNSLLKLCMRYK